MLLPEREAQPGHHSIVRSAAMFMESHGPPQVRALTCVRGSMRTHCACVGAEGR
ncbi:hypothetical protein [Calidifontimicrobium sp. SYSU G02091]|uniref:hypothetical protein n=1 Tax=Calidifontimicrobium sp. SYSU G02091 TaxID=2926421 RepID=UPI0023515667|nr:hypothetical protein [Calidifontimicrobium sp. SYSU G02091]